MSKPSADSISNFLCLMYGVGRLRRFQGCFALEPQSVAVHTHNALGIYLLFKDAFVMSPNIRIYEAILLHDWTEPIIGDVPYPVKAKHPSLKDLLLDIETSELHERGLLDHWPTMNVPEETIVKFVDMFELLAYTYLELSHGNRDRGIVSANETAAVVLKSLAISSGKEIDPPLAGLEQGKNYLGSNQSPFHSTHLGWVMGMIDEFTFGDIEWWERTL